jgi:hypothetical protein
MHPRTGQHVGPFGLVKYGVMARVDLIPPVDVSREQPFVASLPERRHFMSRRVGPQHVSLIEIVAVCQSPTRMVHLEPEIVKIFVDGDDGREGIDGFVVRQMLLYKRSEDPNGMGRIEVKTSREPRQDRLGSVAPLIVRVGGAIYEIV